MLLRRALQDEDSLSQAADFQEPNLFPGGERRTEVGVRSINELPTLILIFFVDQLP